MSPGAASSTGGSAGGTFLGDHDRRTFLLAALATLAFAATVLLVRRYDAAPILAAVLLLAAALPLLIWPETGALLAVFLLYTNIPFLATRSTGIPESVAASFILLLGLPLLRQLIVQRIPLHADRIFPLLLLFLGVLLVSSLGAAGPAVAADYIVKYCVEGLLLYFLVINAVRTLSTLRRVIWTMVAAGALLGGLSVYQEVTGSFNQRFGGLAERNFEYLELRRQLELQPDNEVLQEQLRSHGTGDRSRRAEGPMDEPNRYGQILVVLLPLAVFKYRNGVSRAVRGCAAGAGLLILGGIMASQSRGTFVAVGFLVLLGLFVKWIRPSHLLIGALMMLPLAPVVAPGLIGRLLSIGNAVELVERDNAVEADGAIRGRATAMLAAYQAFLDHPILGVGPGQYTPFYSEEYQQKDPRLKFRELRTARRAHSLYLEMAAELGVIGTGVFLSIVLVLMRNLWRARQRWIRHQRELADLATAFVLVLAGYLANAVFLHLSYGRYYWLLIALAGASLLVIAAKETEMRPFQRRT